MTLHRTGSRKNNIAIAGLTAAGKTTHAKLIAAEFGLRYVSASSILGKKAGLPRHQARDFWLTDEGRNLRARIRELDVDGALRDAEDARDWTVFDCRSLPWLARNRILSIWLDSSPESRVLKSLVSVKGKSKLSAEEVRVELDQKDLDDCTTLRAFGFDLLNDRAPMDVVLDLSDLISEPSKTAAWRSIQQAKDIVSAVVGLYLTGDDFYRVRLRRLQEQTPLVFAGFSSRFRDLLNG